ncbi:MAG TPA: hypothetical protein DEF00_03635 [Candidatus Taylorbacteria bacterium]|nr:hypothetical protein [Candidatus Taylorbacteria bacterium]
MTSKIIGASVLLLILVAVAYALAKTNSVVTYTSTLPPQKAIVPTPTSTSTSEAKPKRMFTESFNSAYTVAEAESKTASKSAAWWVSSGAYLFSKNGVGSTIMGSLPADDPWRKTFSISNPLDTDDGYHPQNIFRLVLKSQWLNLEQEAYFKVLDYNLSVSPNRNFSNGLLFFNRYQDAFNLYYTGIRVDGYVTIKKKIGGTYYTLAHKPFVADSVYHRDSNPTLLPQNTWIGLRSEVTTNADQTVSIKLYVDNGRTGNWVLAAEANDDGKSYGGAALLNEGYAGIRTDFMDVEFDDYKIVAQ